MASFFDDEAEVGTTDDEDEMETEGTLKVRKFLNVKRIWSKIHAVSDYKKQSYKKQCWFFVKI